MSNKNRLLISLVAGINTALLLLIIMLGIEIIYPGKMFGSFFGPAKVHAETNLAAPNLAAKAPPTPTIPPEVMKALAVDIAQPGSRKANGKFPTDWTPGPTPTPQKWTPKATPSPVVSEPAVEAAPLQVQNAPPSLPPLPGIMPAKLRIPAAGIDAPVEHLGLDSAGRPDVPKNYWHVGWLKLGPQPGERGNAVIDGHVDSPTAAAVFYNLRKLKVGDQIFVTDAQGKQLVFEVFETAVYPYNDAPLDKIFGHSDEAQLNLITCTGVFNRASQNYDKRFVVFSRLVNRG